MTSQGILHQERPFKDPVNSRYRGKRTRQARDGFHHRRDLLSATAGLCLLFAAILASPASTSIARIAGTGLGVSAAPCSTGNTTATGGVAVEITPTTSFNLTNIFNCEDGDFQVVWSGAVNVTGTIYIGQGTTVTIVGDATSNATTTTEAGSNSSSSSSRIGSSGQSGSSTSIDEFDILTGSLSIPGGLTSAVVGVGSRDVDADTDESISFGPIFSVDGGQLFLENIAIRSGFAVNTTKNGEAVNGGAIYALYSNVTATGCEFEDNFAEFWGGAIFANRSTLVTVNSVFRGCRAGFQAEAGEDDVDGAGGAIAAVNTDMLVEGCLFEECYASKKGGAMHQSFGQISVLSSVFYNNSAGSDNVEDEDEIGEGAALSFTVCVTSFDGLSSCGVNDTYFAHNHVGRKGGAVVIGSGDSPSYVEFHRCRVADSVTGTYIKDDPQGEGGAFAVGEGITLVLSDCVVTNNYCGKKGGAITLSSGGDWENDPGATVILRNSTFESNTADVENGGVAYLGEYSTVTVLGDGNVFTGNECDTEGAVFSGAATSNITIEGGVFRDNKADTDGGVIWTKGLVEVMSGQFLNNEASDRGGVFFAADDSTVILVDGVLEGNEAYDGGVAHVGEDAIFVVESGTFSGNAADNSGGVFAVSEGGNIQITGGNFSSNTADFGGFLYKEGDGTASCEGASILKHEGVDGGAIYAVDDATLDWACDLEENSALAGPAIYARDGSTVVLRGISLIDNYVARGSVVFVVDSHLKTYQVTFKDTTKSLDLSAVQVDKDSSYMAEDTSFGGFQGEAIVYSEGTLYLDDCDFSGSTAPQLVYSEPNSTVVIRNTVLGDSNYLALSTASSLAEEIPNADSLTNANFTCGDGGEDAGVGSSSSSSNVSAYSPCSEGSLCLEGDLGVYCQCYLQLSTSEQRCVDGDATALNLTIELEPGTSYYPDMLKGDLVLSHGVSAESFPVVSNRSANNTTGLSASLGASSTSQTGASSSEVDSTSNNSSIKSNERDSSISSSGGDGNGGGAAVYGGSDIGVVWNVAALQQSIGGNSMMEWTVFPSTGLLLPGESITLRVVTLPSTSFDGTTTVTFAAAGVESTSASLQTSTTSEQSNTDNDRSDAAPQAQATSTYSSSQLWNDTALGGRSGWVSNTTTAQFNVTFYHCEAGEIWNATFGADGNCELCSDVVEGEEEGVGCEEPGVTITTLPVEEGYWRASLEVVYIRECYSEDACKGGSDVSSVQDYCNDGYIGPECAVCDFGYGRGAADECHRCTTSFKAGMYFVLAISTVCAVVVMSLLSVYLIGGRGAVTSTVASTKESVMMLQRRSTVLLGRSDGGGGRSDFTLYGSGKKPRPNSVSGEEIAMTSGIGTKPSIRRSSANIRSSGIGSGLQSGGGTGRIGGSLFTPRKAPLGRVRPGPPLSHKTTGLATLVPARYSGSPSLPPLPAEETRGPVSDGRSSSNDELSGSSDTTTRQQACKISATRAYGGPETEVGVVGPMVGGGQPPSHEQHPPEEGDEKDGESTPAARIGVFFAELPLSKLKIVIVVWQISAAFADITNVAYPPIYEKFLSIIGIFSLDLAWILSAACLTTDVNFYDKLLIVTIGPLVILGLLGLTFHVGARPASPVATPEPISRKNPSRSYDTSVLQAIELSPSERSGRQNTTSSQTIELPPPSRPVLTRGRPSRRFNASEDTIGLSLSEHHTVVRAQSTSRCERSTSASDLATQGRTTRGRQSSSRSTLHANMDDASEIECDLSIMRTSSNVGGEAASKRSSSSGSVVRSMGKRQPSLRSVWKAGPGNKADPDQDRLWGLFARHTTMTLILLYLVYSQVSTVVFQTFSCEGFPEVGMSYLRADRRIECYTTAHVAYKTYAAVMIFLYPLGIPATFYYLLSSKGSSINPPTDNSLREERGSGHVVREKINQRSTDLSIAPTSFLWNAYYPNRYYFEVFECLRRLVLTGLLVFLVPDTSGQVAFSCIFAFVSLLAFELQRPHTDALEIQLYRTGCLVIFFTNFLALMIKAEVADEDSASSAIYSVVLIMVNIMFFLSIWWNTWATIKSTFSRRGFQGTVVGVDLVGEDDVDTFLGPNKKHLKRNVLDGDDADGKVDSGEELPNWEDRSIDVESCSSIRSGKPLLQP